MSTSDQTSELRQKLEKLFAHAKLPTSPAIASRILELIDDPRSSAKEFAEFIEADPAIAARLLKMANSARYVQRKRCATIQRAITVIGLRQLRITVLGFELVAHLDRLGDCPFDLESFWQQSVLRGCLAREIARQVVPDLAEEAFLVGLLLECGELVLVQMYGPKYAALCAERLSPSAFYAAERKQFPHTHAEAMGELASLWGLPQAIAAPLAGHHDEVRVTAASFDALKLSAVAYFVGTLVLDNNAAAAPADRALLEYARRDLRLSSGDLERCFASAAEAYAPTAEVFDGQIDPGADVTAILTNANRLLMEEASESADRVHEIEAERDQALGDQVTLRSALGQYREQAARDPLTMILNRGAVIEEATRILLDPTSGDHVAPMFVDIDNFKPINDQHGHAAGDNVLRRVAEIMAATIGDQGVLGRYGGEEFVALLFGVDEAEVHRIATDMLQQIREETFPPIMGRGHITCSLGAYWCSRSDASDADDLFHIADELMYLAKRTGKDRACVRSVYTPELVHTVGAGELPDAVTPGVSLGDSFIDGPPCRETFAKVAAALNEQKEERFAELRKQNRRSVGAVCTVRFFDGGTIEMRAEDGFVRTSSTGGVGVLCGRPLARGDIVEVEIDAGAEGTIFVAGVIAHTRPITGTVHEMGIQLFDRSRNAILSADPAAALADLNWVAEVLEKGAAMPGLRKSA